MVRLLKSLLVVCLLAAPGWLHGQDQVGQAGAQVEMQYATSDDAKVGYLLYLPKDYKADGEQSFPLIFFLHGRGESNGPLSLVAKWGPPMMAERGDELPFIIVSPQCPREDSWASETQQKRLTELLDQVVDDHAVDEKKIFLTGLSMGGYGSWKMAAMHPQRFAAVAPVCGGGTPADAEKLKSIPIWVFHGDQDRAVPFQKSVEMVDAIRAAGGTSIRFTSLENIGHNSWSAAYATPELYQWMNKQSAQSDSAPPNSSSNADVTGTWKWDREFNGNTISFTLRLEQDGEKLNGTYKTEFGDGGGPPGMSDPVEISAGKISGDEISFEVTREFNGTELTVFYSGVVSGDEIAGATEMDFGGEARDFDWGAKRESSDKKKD